jgi:hypothetical protein
MRSIFPLVFLFFLLLSSTGVSQDPDEGSVEELYQAFQAAYGPDQNLVCGVRYYNLHTWYDGHKFFMEDRFARGKLILDNGSYPDVFLKYDLYDQQLILQVNYSDGNYNEIIVTDSRLKEFELEGRIFRKLYFPETDTLIFQVIGKEDPVCIYHWTKEIIPNSAGLNSVDEFSKMKRRSYVVTNSSLHRFKGASSFAKSFPGHRAEVMNYIRREKLRFSKAGDTEMQGLINYCSNLLKEE